MNLRSFKPATADNRNEILDYLYSDLGNCLYLSLDIERFEIGGGTILVWLQRNDAGTIIAVAMRFADSYQIYARENDCGLVDYGDLVTLIHSIDTMRISAPSRIIKGLLPDLKAEYNDSYGVVMEICKYRKIDSPEIIVEKATKDDIPEIVNLILMDEMFGRSYNPKRMCNQFEDSFSNNTGASYIIRSDGRIIAHLGLAAIGRAFLIASYTIVHPEFRSYPYGAFLDSHLINELLPELGKRGFAFMQEPRRIKLFEIMGNPIVGEYGKLLKVKKCSEEDENHG